MIFLFTFEANFTNSSYGIIPESLHACINVLSDDLVVAITSTESPIATSYPAAFALQRFIEIVPTTGR